MGTLVNEQGKNINSFFHADSLFDFLLSIGMRPFVELSFMPSALASGPDMVFHYRGNITPPKKMSDWTELIRTLAGHWIERYGQKEVRSWFFEVWNEPNLKAFWISSQKKYFDFYAATAKALKSVDRQLVVGGPATAANAWIPEFLEYASKENIPVDFVSTHHYPTDAFGQPGDNTVAQLAASHRSVLREEAAKAKQQAEGKPLYYTEWCTSSNPFDDLHDQPYAAAYIAKTVLEAQGLVEGYSYWTFSDIFEENYFSSLPFHGGFGLMTIYGIPKPAYRAYELLHQLGEWSLAIEGEHETVDAWLFLKDGLIQLLLVNSALPEHPVQTEFVGIELSAGGKVKTAYIERIDENHCNPRRQWEAMGSPGTLLPVDVTWLMKCSVLNKEPMIFQQHGTDISFTIAMPPQGIACITLEVDKETTR